MRRVDGRKTGEFDRAATLAQRLPRRGTHNAWSHRTHMRHGRHVVGPKHKGPTRHCDQALGSGPRVSEPQPTATDKQRPQEPTARMLCGPRRNFGHTRAVKDASRLAGGLRKRDLERESPSRAANFERLAPLTTQPGSRVDLAPLPQKVCRRGLSRSFTFRLLRSPKFSREIRKVPFRADTQPVIRPMVVSWTSSGGNRSFTAAQDWYPASCA